MAQSVQRLQGAERLNGEQVRVFGVRHLSPAGAYHLRTYLDEIKPTAVLVEGPSDANAFIGQLTKSGVKPPVALLAYTGSLPVRTLLFPLAAYSPEYQAFVWANKRGVPCEFIDLPTDRSLALLGLREKGGEDDVEEDAVEKRRAHAGWQHSLYESIAELADEPDYEAYWERHYEHAGSQGAYHQAIHAFSASMRELTEAEERTSAPQELAYNELREAFMRRRICEVMAAGHEPNRIVVIVGAHHASAVDLSLPAMTDAELGKLPSVPTSLTLMPYTYYKLSSHSGYGAGNQAPAYYQLFWECLTGGKSDELPTIYMTRLATLLREAGTYRSTASVIEAVRMSEALASLKGGSRPTWKDLRDAAVVCLGNGDYAVIAEALARIDVGTEIGKLPEGVSQTPIQDDLNRELKRLKLEKYKTAVAQDLELDLRENRRVKSEEAAYLDLNRSVLLHRLEILGIGFARKQAVHQESASWAERWVLQWTPEAEIQAVESTLKGETIQIAAAYVIHERLQQCENLAEAAKLIRVSCECRLVEAMGESTRALQELATEAGNFEQIAGAAFELSALVRYGSVRRLETESLVPLLKQLFLRGALLLVDSANCNDDAARGMAAAIQQLHAVAQEHYEEVDEAQWRTRLRELATRDDRNAKLSGFAFAILLERDEISADECSQEVSRRLSPGVPADLGAGWFEGLSMRNRYALLSRAALWEQLDLYVQSLEDEPFYRSLVFLRRAFADFEPRERASVTELLGDLWGAGAEQTSEELLQPLGEEEKKKLDELNEFDFGDL